MSSDYSRKRKRHLWDEQGGRCHWCNRPLGALVGPASGVNVDDLATLDHLDERTDRCRGTTPWKIRTVLACAGCNNYRSSGKARAARFEVVRVTVAGQA